MASARAIATRCCWPPESWLGRWSNLSARPTRLSSARARLPARRGQLLHQARRQHHVAAGAQVREQVEGLEDHAHALAQRARGSVVCAHGLDQQRRAGSAPAR
jgi:hypothetical protein